MQDWTHSFGWSCKNVQVGDTGHLYLWELNLELWLTNNDQIKLIVNLFGKLPVDTFHRLWFDGIAIIALFNVGHIIILLALQQLPEICDVVIGGTVNCRFSHGRLKQLRSVLLSWATGLDIIS